MAEVTLIAVHHLHMQRVDSALTRPEARRVESWSVYASLDGATPECLWWQQHPSKERVRLANRYQ